MKRLSWLMLALALCLALAGCQKKPEAEELPAPPPVVQEAPPAVTESVEPAPMPEAELPPQEPPASSSRTADGSRSAPAEPVPHP